MIPQTRYRSVIVLKPLFRDVDRLSLASLVLIIKLRLSLTEYTFFITKKIRILLYKKCETNFFLQK